MAGQGVTLYSATSAGNKAIVGTIDWRENIYMPSSINDNVAQIMADIRALANSVGLGWVEIGDADGTYTAVYALPTQFAIMGADVTAYYRAGMRVRVVAPTPGTISGTIVSSAFSTNTTINVLWDSGSGLSNEAITSVSIGVGSGGGAGGQLNYRNILGRNGGFEVWQRGAGGSANFTLAASAGQYTADGWYVLPGANQITSVVQGGGGVAASRFSMVVQRVAGQTGVGTMYLEFPLDTDEIVPMRNQIVTLSFNAVAGANWSPAGGTLTCNVWTGTGAPTKATFGFTGAVFVIAAGVPLTSASTRFSLTSSIVVPIGATQASCFFSWTPVATAGAADYFYIDDVQLEIGSVATPFERRPFESELLACQRHYEKTFPYSVAPAQATSNYNSILATNYASTGGSIIDVHWRYATRKRVSPTVTTYNPISANGLFRNVANTIDITLGTLTTGEAGMTFISSGLAANGDAGVVHAVADAGI